MEGVTRYSVDPTNLRPIEGFRTEFSDPIERGNRTATMMVQIGIRYDLGLRFSGKGFGEDVEG